jgi:beta-glucuronidase
MSKYTCFLLLSFFFSVQMFSQRPLIVNLPSRNKQSLNGKWQYIVDPYETGFRNYRWDERAENDREAYWNSDVPENKTDRKEHGYNDKYT